jgi:hypothetical protein
MSAYGTATLLIIITIIILLIALYSSVAAMRELKGNNFVNPTTDINYVNNVLIFLIIVEVVMIIVALYGLIKVRSSNLGGVFGFILGLILVVFVVIFASLALNKVSYPEFPFVIKTLSFAAVFIPAAFLMLMASTLVKPRFTSNGGVGKKIMEATKQEINKMKAGPPQGQGEQLYEVDEILVEGDRLRPVDVSRVQPVHQVQQVKVKPANVEKEVIYTSSVSSSPNKYIVSPSRSVVRTTVLD